MLENKWFHSLRTAEIARGRGKVVYRDLEISKPRTLQTHSAQQMRGVMLRAFFALFYFAAVSSSRSPRSPATLIRPKRNPTPYSTTEPLSQEVVQFCTGLVHLNGFCISINVGLFRSCTLSTFQVFPGEANRP